MKAVIFSKYGAADVLRVTELNKPQPKDHEILIKVQAAEVTKTDCEMRAFKFPVQWFALPLRIALGVFKPKKQILGGYFSGQVEAIGKAVSQFKCGQKIFGSCQFHLGAYGRYVCLPEHYTLVTKPNNCSFAQAAAIPLGGLNALHFLNLANIKAGQHLLINGAGGSIGLFSIQIAKAMGAKVTAVDMANKENLLRHAGADYFIDYRQQDISKTSKRYDLILSTVAKSRFFKLTKLLKPEGRYLIANPRISDMLNTLLISLFSQKKAYFSFAKETKAELLTLKQMIEENKINVIVDKVYAYEQAADAHRRVESEQRLGAIILTADPKQANYK